MNIPQKIIDNRNITLADFIKEVLITGNEKQLDIATAFFNVGAFSMIKDALTNVDQFRLLLGTNIEIQNHKTLGQDILNGLDDRFKEYLQEDIETLPLTSLNESTVKTLIAFLKKDSVQVKLFNKTFLHGKAYIFDDVAVIGSSNFTTAGLTHNTELNVVSLQAEAEYVRKHWFNLLWDESVDFKEELIKTLEESRFGTTEYSPYEIFIKTLYEYQKDDVDAIFNAQDGENLTDTKVDLSNFQEDAVQRAFTRFKKYGGVLVADSVGLGKTWIAKRIIEHFGFGRREKFLVVCPASLKKMWSDELKDIILPEYIVSHEEFALEDYKERIKKSLGVREIPHIPLIVIDESHNFRNPLANKWEHLYTFIEELRGKGDNEKEPYVLLLTATPINNTIWDLYNQIILITKGNETAFVGEGIENLKEYFRTAFNSSDTTPLGDIMNEISIRRTRSYIKANYPDATIRGKKIEFPKPKLENLNYKLDDTYQGMYKEIADTIANKLTMAYYKYLTYRKDPKLTVEESFDLNRMIQISGIFRTILLKRFESSVESFKLSVEHHKDFLKKLKQYLSKGKMLTKKYYQKYNMILDDENSGSIKEQLENFDKDKYYFDRLTEDIDRDIEAFDNLYKIANSIAPEKDAKLVLFKKNLLELANKGKVLVFSYYTDTLNYIYKEVVNDSRFSSIRIARISGETSASARQKVVKDFTNGKYNVLMSTDVLSEGQNLQAAHYLVNYDLHWNPTRMIQRKGRIDRIGSPYKTIYIYNFFPEDELENLLGIVETLHRKISKIDDLVGLDSTILGEEVHPKVFGIIRKIRNKDSSVIDELENDAFGGGESFYQPLRDYLKSKGLEAIRKIPYGVYSGLKRDIKGIFFYYKYDEDFHFWYLYDVVNKKLLKSKSEILNFIACRPEERRVIPDFYKECYNASEIVTEEIETAYARIREAPLDYKKRLNKERGYKFVLKLHDTLEKYVDEYEEDYPADEEYINKGYDTVDKLYKINFTKHRAKELRSIWRKYTNNLITTAVLLKETEKFINKYKPQKVNRLEPFDSSKLKLITIDFVS